MNKFFSRPVRTVLAFACAFASVSPAFGGAADVINNLTTDNGTNVNANNRVTEVSGALVLDYHANFVEKFYTQITELLIGTDFGVSDLQNISVITPERSVGVIRWSSFNVDAGKTLVVAGSNLCGGNATLYNIVDGGGMSTIAGTVTSYRNLPVGLQTLLGAHSLVSAIGLNGNQVNTWFINPAGISITSGARIDLNGYLGLVAGSAQQSHNKDYTYCWCDFNTEGVGSKSGIYINDGVSINLNGPIYLFGNNIKVDSILNSHAYVANGNDVLVSKEVSYDSHKNKIVDYHFKNKSTPTIDTLELSVSGSFYNGLTLISASDLNLGDLSVSGPKSSVAAMAGDIKVSGDVRFYSAVDITADKGSITINTDEDSTAAFKAEGALAISARDDILLDGSDNLFLGEVTAKSALGSIELGASRKGDHVITDSALTLTAENGDISISQYSGDIKLGGNHTIQTAADGKLSLKASTGNITVGSDVKAWNHRLGDVTAKGDVNLTSSVNLDLLGSVSGANVMISASEIFAAAEGENSLTATKGDIKLTADNGIDFSGSWKIAAEKGSVEMVNRNYGDLVIGRPYKDANAAKIEVTARNVKLEQRSRGDLVVEENAKISATGTTTDDSGITLRHAGDLYVFGGLSQDLPDFAQGFDDDGKPKAYKLPTIESTGEGVVKAMSLDMRQRDYKLSDLKGEFGTWDHLEFVKFYNLGETLTVDKDLTLKSATAGSRTGNRSQYVFEGAGDLTVDFSDRKTMLDASATGVRFVTGDKKTLTFTGSGAVVTGNKALVIDAGKLTSDGEVTIKAGILELRNGVEVALLDNKHVYVDSICGEAGDISLQANAYLDADAFRLAGDLKAKNVLIDTGKTVSQRRDFIGGTETGDPTDSSNLYELNAETLSLALRSEAKLYLKSSEAVKIQGFATESGQEAFTTVADLRFDAPKGITLAGNKTKGTLSVTDLGTGKMSGDVYFREAKGSMDVKTPIKTTGNATFIAASEGKTLTFSETPNDIDGTVSIAANSSADVNFANVGALNVSRISGNNVTLKSVNNDVTIAKEGAYVQGTISLDAQKGNATIERQTATDENGESTGRWAGRLGKVTAQGTVAVTTSEKLVLEDSMTAGAAVLTGDEGIDGNNQKISLTDQNLVPNDEYVHRTSGQLTAISSKGAVKLGEEGDQLHRVTSFSAEARDGVTFANDQQLKLKSVTVKDGDATVRANSTLTVAGTVKADNITLRAGQQIDFDQKAVIKANTGTKFVVDNSDFTLDLDAVESRTVRSEWNLGKISATAGTEDFRRNVTIVGQAEKDLVIGEINGYDVKLAGKASVIGDAKSSVNADRQLTVTADAGDVTLAGKNTIKGAATLEAKSYTVEKEDGETETLGGSVAVKNQTVLKLASIQADAEVGTVDLEAKSIVSAVPGAKHALVGQTVNLKAENDIDLDLEGSAKLNKVAAQNVRFTATDEGASLSIADGSMDNFSAVVDGDLAVKNDRGLGLGAVVAGGAANFDVAGALQQNGRTLYEDRISVEGLTVKAQGDVVLDNPYNYFGSKILTETTGKAVFSAADGLNFAALKATEAELEGGTGDIKVENGSIDSLMATAEGELTVQNDKALTLREIDVAELDIEAKGDVKGTEAVVTRSSTAQNRVAADGRVELTSENNVLGPVLTVAADTARVVNKGDIVVDSKVTGNIDYLNQGGDMLVVGDTIAGGHVETRGGDLAVAANTIASAANPLEVASDKRIDVTSTGDASIHRTDGGWTLGPGGKLSVGGNLNLNVEGTLATAGDGVVAAAGNVSLKAKDYAPEVALKMGGSYFQADRQSYGGYPQWALFRTVGGNEYPHIIPHDGVWVVINGHLTPSVPDYAYIATMDQDHILSTPVLNPTAQMMNRPYLLADAAYDSIDLVGLGRYPYINLKNENIEYKTIKE